jgi:hypothetical protein
MLMADISLKAIPLILLLAVGCKAERKKADLVSHEKTVLRHIGLTVEIYRQSYGHYPARLGELAMLEPDIDAFSIDDWGTPIRYTVSAGNFIVQSAGPDGTFRTADDITFSREDIDPNANPSPASKSPPVPEDERQKGISPIIGETKRG